MYKPEFKGPVEGWVVNYSKTQFWRVSGSMEWQDLMQDAYLVYLRCAGKYPEVDTGQHFMALFKMAWVNHVTDLANRDTKQRSEVSQVMEHGGEQFSVEPMGETDNNGLLAIMIKQAPREVLLVLNLLLNAPQEMVDAVFSGWNGRDRRGSTVASKKVCKALGLPATLDVMGMVEDYFQR